MAENLVLVPYSSSSRKLATATRFGVAAIGLSLGLVSPSSAATRPATKGISVLYVFDNFFRGPGRTPSGGLLVDSAGDLFGTALMGGTTDEGVLFELTRSRGLYGETFGHSFSCYVDGCNPAFTPTEDSSGNIFAVTTGYYGGLVRLSPSAAGYQETARYDFPPSDAVGQPIGGVVLIGKTAYVVTSTPGSLYASGMIYGFTATTLQPTLLYTFSKATGYYPFAGIVADASGALYGTTGEGGTANAGTVFKFVPTASGGSYSVLYSFQGGSDGAGPAADLTIDQAGNIYGTTALGGYGDGTIFELTPGKSGYTESIFHRFSGRYDGFEPNSMVLRGATLWGTTQLGGQYRYAGCNCWTIFSLGTSGAGFTVQHSFAGPEGSRPNGGLSFYGGAWLGSTQDGGPNASSSGVIFSFVP